MNIQTDPSGHTIGTIGVTPELLYPFSNHHLLLRTDATHPAPDRRSLPLGGVGDAAPTAGCGHAFDCRRGLRSAHNGEEWKASRGCTSERRD